MTRWSPFLRAVLGLGLVALGSPLVMPAAPPATAAAEPVEQDTWAWCGVDPDLADAEASARSMAEVAGIDVTFGPCISPTGPYSPAFPGDRYADPDVYQRLVELNSSLGMRTVVYDARLWDPDPLVRDTALDQWAPFTAHIAAWDLGDEFDPYGSEWPILIQRWQTVRADATARTGIEPFVNHLYWGIEPALRDLPGSSARTSFTRYVGDKGAQLAREHDRQVENLLCGVNAFTHQIFFPSPASIRADMALLRDAGCDTFLVFGGHRVFGTDAFGTSSLTNPDGSPTSWAAAVKDGATLVDRTGPPYQPVSPVRLLDTRNGTIPAARSTTTLPVVGRNGVPTDVEAVVLAVTVTEPRGPGFLTVFPCGSTRPNAASLTYDTGRTVLNLVVVRPGTDGSICLYTQESTHLVVDLSGYHPAGSRIRTVDPARLLETRSGPGLGTVDGRSADLGIRPVGTVTTLPVTGRAGVPTGATAVIANVTVTGSTAPGFVTLFPCGSGVPTAANLTFDTGTTVSNAVMVGLDGSGAVCVFNSSEAHVILDVNGYVGEGAPYVALQPGRAIDTRVDGGRPRAGDTVEVPVAGVSGVPTDAHVAVVNLTAVTPAAAGFVTAHACGTDRPTVATLTFGAGETRSALAVVTLGTGGQVCLYSSAAADLVVDVSGYHVD